MALYLVVNNQTDPHYNLALEEYLLKEGQDEYFLFWRNAPAVIIGKYQNAFAEVNLPYAEQAEIEVVRRISGGGAVYHDLGNLNYSFLLNRPPGELLDLPKYSRPMVEALQALGVPAELNGRNDITAAGRKISGNAQYASSGRLLHHGTLLFDTDFARMQQVLTVDADKIAAKGIESVRARVANIREFIPQTATLADFQSLLQTQIWQSCAVVGEYRLTQQDEAAIASLQESQYNRWEWNIGRSPQARFHRKRRVAAGSLEVFLTVESGLVQGIEIYGDFFAEPAWDKMIQGLIGLPYHQAAIQNYLTQFAVADFCAGLTEEDLLSCLFAE